MSEDLDNETFISDLEDRSTHGPPDYVKCARHPGVKLASPLGVMPLEHLIVDYFRKKIYATKLYLSQEDADALFTSVYVFGKELREGAVHEAYEKMMGCWDSLLINDPLKIPYETGSPIKRYATRPLS